MCPIADTAPFKETTYGVRLKVRNPSEPGAARSWRVELWEEGASFPVSATRGIRGMEVSGPMQAALSQENQLLGSAALRTPWPSAVALEEVLKSILCIDCLDYMDKVEEIVFIKF